MHGFEDVFEVIRWGVGIIGTLMILGGGAIITMAIRW